MNNRTTRIVLVVLTSLLCGLPGLAGFCLGPLAVLGSLLPESDLAPSDASAALIAGILLFFFSLVLIAIPIATGIFMLGKRGGQKPNEPQESIPLDDF